MRNCNNNTLFAGCSFCSLQYERDMNIYYPFVHGVLASLWLQNLNKQASGRCI